ncbi:MAG TPA: ABC transporter permease [bacterium]|nr:ABC transporter permease [bacterium]
MIQLTNIRKSYRMGDTTVHALQGVSVSIEAGDFVAVMGPSGSGKSTLMHVIGLLDVPDSGSYKMEGREVADLSEKELAVLRRETIGFIFQQFNLLPRMTAVENVSMPTLYSRHELDDERAKMLLDKTGLGTRSHHRPNELSGGQQQRVAIARSLINKPRMILADEPTGNLDSKSEAEIMAILKELNAMGITIVMVTHEEEIGQHAKRLIRMRDGQIQSDERLDGPLHASAQLPVGEAPTNERGSRLEEIWEYFKQGFRSLAANKVRAGLSMLGILIGVAAVVAMLALGSGAQKAIQQQLASLGSNLLSLRPGAVRVGGVALDAGAVTRLTLDDATEIQTIPGVKRASPLVNGRGQVTFEDRNWNTQIQGATASYAEMHAAEPVVGRFFTDEENARRALVAVVGMTVVKNLFGDQNPMGEMIKINKVNFRVIGILPEKGATGFRDQDDVVAVPVLTAMHRLLGKDYVDSIDIEAEHPDDIDAIQGETQALMLSRHRVPPSQQQDAFQVRNLADIKEAMEESSRTMSALLASIAAISLVVGGIGIMNIMLVSVTERTREIGLRKAVGAEPNDILFQFLAESVVVSVVGGVMGIALGWLATAVLSAVAGWTTSISPESVFLSVFFSSSIGLLFGIYPAKRASQLNPIEALRYE